jgi:TatD DNase family protein
MVALFDTHVHFSDLHGEYLLAAQIQRAAAVGVQRMIAVGGSCALNKSAAEAAEAHPRCIRAAIGFDRDQVAELSSAPLIEDAIGRLRRAISALKGLGATVSAIGEIGLDYHYNPQTATAQVALFTAQCDLATELGLPVIVHSREADDDTLRVLDAYAADCKSGGTCGVLHCFTGNADFARRLLASGFMISFSGIVTFRSADALRSVATMIPADRLLVETDSPYLAPEPHRGKRNEPALVHEVAASLARVRGESLDTLAAQTTANAHRLFGTW